MIHPDRARRTAELAALDPADDWQEIYKRLTIWELWREARFGFQIAFYRPLAVPRMAEVLRSTGHVRRDTTRRAYDTGLVVHEIIWGGVDSERGQKMIRLMNRLHDRPDIHAEDMSYLLDTLIVVPTQFMDRWGWRTVTAAEREATWRFWDVLGERIGIADRSSSFADAERRMAVFDQDGLAPSAAGQELTASIVKSLRTLLPAPVRPLAAQLTSVLIGDSKVSAALALPDPTPAVARVVATGGALRRLVQRVMPGSRRPSFWPGRHAGNVYPHGYTLDQLGPQH